MFPGKLRNGFLLNLFRSVLHTYIPCPVSSSYSPLLYVRFFFPSVFLWLFSPSLVPLFPLCVVFKRVRMFSDAGRPCGQLVRSACCPDG